MTVKINTHHRIIGIISTKDISHHINIYIFLTQTKCRQSVFCSSINFTTFCQYRRGISASGTLICQHLITLITLPTSVSFRQMYRCWQIYCRIANIYTYHLYLLLSDPTLYIKCNSISKLLTEV